MKTTRLLAMILVAIAVLLTGLGGFMDAWRDGSFQISKQHAWNDGVFLMLVAIFLVVAF